LDHFKQIDETRLFARTGYLEHIERKGALQLQLKGHQHAQGIHGRHPSQLLESEQKKPMVLIAHSQLTMWNSVRQAEDRKQAQKVKL